MKMHGLCAGLEGAKGISSNWLMGMIDWKDYSLKLWNVWFYQVLPFDNIISFTKRRIFLRELSAAFIFINIKKDYLWKTSIGEKKILFGFVCPNCKTMENFLYQVADLILGTVIKNVVTTLADKMNDKGVNKKDIVVFYCTKPERKI